MLQPPTSFTVTQIAALPDGSTQLRATWVNGHPAAYTEVWFSDGSYAGNFGNPGDTSCIISGLAPNTTYTMGARHAIGTPSGTVYSQFSNQSSATTQAAMGIPSAPTVTQIAALPDGVTQLALTWTNFNNIDYVQVYRNGGYIAHLAPGTTSFTDTGLTANTTYSYQMIHYRFTDDWYSPGLSAATNGTTQVKFDAPTVTSVVPPADANIGQSQLVVTWTNAQAGDPIDIYRHITSWVYVGQVPAGTTQWTDTGIPASQSRAYAVAHARNGYNTGIVQWIWGTTQAVFLSPTITYINADSPSRITIGWTNGASDLVQIYRYDTGNPGWVYRGTLAAGSTSWQDTGLAEQRGYYYALAHHRSGYETPWSNQVYAATTARAWQFFLTGGNYDWYWPGNVTSVYAECLGGSGGSGHAYGRPSAGGGGQGGSYAARWLGRGPEAYLSIIMGYGGHETYPGGQTYVIQNGAVNVSGPGGHSGVPADAADTGGAGGYGANGSPVGDVWHWGGNGGTGNPAAGGGSGGGAAGPAGDGGAANGSISPGGRGPGAFQDGQSYQNDGAAAPVTGPGNPGNAYGGGASGARKGSLSNQEGNYGAAGICLFMFSTD